MIWICAFILYGQIQVLGPMSKAQCLEYMRTAREESLPVCASVTEPPRHIYKDSPAAQQKESK